MEGNSFSRIQISGASPTDANWKFARRGFQTWKELFHAMFGEESNDKSFFKDRMDNLLNNTALEELESDVNNILNWDKTQTSYQRNFERANVEKEKKLKIKT